MKAIRQLYYHWISMIMPKKQKNEDFETLHSLYEEKQRNENSAWEKRHFTAN